MATKKYLSVDELRQQAQELLVRARKLEREQKAEKYNSLGELVVKNITGEISYKEFIYGVENLTGKVFLGELSTDKTFSEREIDEAIK